MVKGKEEASGKTSHFQVGRNRQRASSFFFLPSCSFFEHRHGYWCHCTHLTTNRKHSHESKHLWLWDMDRKKARLFGDTSECRINAHSDLDLLCEGNKIYFFRPLLLFLLLATDQSLDGYKRYFLYITNILNSIITVASKAICNQVFIQTVLSFVFLISLLRVYDLNRGQMIFSVKGQLVNILGFIDQPISVTTTQLCHCFMKITTDNM